MQQGSVSSPTGPRLKFQPPEVSTCFILALILLPRQTKDGVLTRGSVIHKYFADFLSINAGKKLKV